MHKLFSGQKPIITAVAASKLINNKINNGYINSIKVIVTFLF